MESDVEKIANSRVIAKREIAVPEGVLRVGTYKKNAKDPVSNRL
jgi:hypothetical protein